MIHKIELIDLGEEAFLPLPKELLTRMNLSIGDELIASTTQDEVTLTLPSATRED